MDYLGRTVVAEVHGKSADLVGFPSELGVSPVGNPDRITFSIVY